MQYEDVFSEKFRRTVSLSNSIIVVGFFATIWWLSRYEVNQLVRASRGYIDGMLALFLGLSAIYIWLIRTVESWPRKPYHAVSFPFLYGGLGLITGFIILPLAQLKNSQDLAVIGMAYAIGAAPQFLLSVVIAAKVWEVERKHKENEAAKGPDNTPTEDLTAAESISTYAAVIGHADGKMRRCPHTHVTSHDAFSCGLAVQSQFPNEIVSVSFQRRDGWNVLESWSIL